MRPTRLATIVAATAAATLALGSAPVGAGDAPESRPIVVDPTSGPAGTDITVSGTDCPGNAPIEAGLIDPDLGHGIAEDFDQSADDDGNWTASLSVPDDAVPSTTYAVVAECLGAGAPEYEDGEFVVTEDEAPPVLPISVDPTRGPVGTTIQVSGSECSSGEVEIYLLNGANLYEVNAVVDYVWGIVPGPDGAWSGEVFVYDTMLEIPDDPEADLVEVDVVPGADYLVAAMCFLDDGSFIASDAVPFDITGGGSAPPRTEAPAVPDILEGPSHAQPATPVVAEPTYTG